MQLTRKKIGRIFVNLMFMELRYILINHFSWITNGVFTYQGGFHEVSNTRFDFITPQLQFPRHEPIGRGLQRDFPVCILPFFPFRFIRICFGFRISDLSLGLPASSRRARPLSSPQSTHLTHLTNLTCCISLGLLWFASSTHAAPRHVYLTWQGDTSTTITVNYQTVEETETSSVYYDTKARNGKISDYRFQAAGTRHKIEGLGDGRTIHWVELTQLKPGVSYYFVAGDLQHGFTAERKFQTIPDGHQPLRFVVGGDMVAGPTLPAFLQQAARHEPKFVAVGGDIAYANDRFTNYTRWDAWLDAWQQGMVTPKGFTVPMVLAIGNHDAHGFGSSPT